MTEIEKKVRIWKELIAHFRQNSYSHGEFEEIEGISKYISECVFAPDESLAKIKSIQENIWKWKRNWKEDEKFFTDFFRLCKEIVKDEEIFGAFQSALTNIKPIDDATIKQFYEEITGAFDSDKFLLCKRILKAVQQKNQSLVWQYYYDTADDLVYKAELKNHPIAKEILVRFCAEIKLDCKPCTREEWEKWKEQKAGYVKQLEEIINKLKEFQEETGKKLDDFKVEIDGFLSKIKDSNDYKVVQINNLNGSTKEFYQEEKKIKDLQKNKDDLQNVKQKVETCRKSVLNIKKGIADEINEVETLVGGTVGDKKLSNITDANVIPILGRVVKKDETVRKKYYEDNNTNIDEYNSQIKRFNALVEQFNKLTEEINKNRENKDGDRNDNIRSLKTKLQKQNKQLTSIFIFLQIILLIVIFIGAAIVNTVYLSSNSDVKSVSIVLYGINAILFICYIIWVCCQFNKYNENVSELKKHSNNEIITFERTYTFWWALAYILGLCMYFFGVLVVASLHNKWKKEGKNHYTKTVGYYSKWRLVGSIFCSCIFFALSQSLLFVIYNL